MAGSGQMLLEKTNKPAESLFNTVERSSGDHATTRGKELWAGAGECRESTNWSCSHSVPPVLGREKLQSTIASIRKSKGRGDEAKENKARLSRPG